MTDLRKAAEMALEALMQRGEHHPKVYQAAEALRQALAQQERLSEITRQFVGVNEDGSERWVETEYRTVIRSEWVGLTDEEMEDLWDRYAHMEMMRAIEAKLKEKNT